MHLLHPSPRFKLLIFCIFSYSSLLAATASNALVDDLWHNFLRFNSAPDTASIKVYLHQLKKRNPPLSESDMSYAITLVAQWSEKLDAPAEKAAIAILCGNYWPEHAKLQPYMPAFYYERALIISEKNNLHGLIANAQSGIINFYKPRYLIDKAVPYVIALEKTMNDPVLRAKLDNQEYHYRALAQYYYRIRKFESAIPYYKKMLDYDLTKESVEHSINVVNTIALCYRALKQYDEAIRYFDEALELAIRLENKQWQYIVKGNKGATFMDMGQLEVATQLLLEDFHGSLSVGQGGSALNACLALAQIALKTNDLKGARNYLETADRMSDSLTVEHLNIILWSDYFAATGEWEKAYQYLHRANSMRDSIGDQFTIEQFYHAREQHSLFRQQTLLNERIENQEVARKAAQRNFFIALGILALVLASFGLIYYSNRRRQGQERRQMQAHLDESRAELDKYVRRLQHHNELSRGIEERILSLSPSVDQAEIKEMLLQFTFSTEEDWEQFKRLFDEVHRDFIDHLKEQPVSLTPGEVRLLTLLKLDFNNREIAHTLGISMDGVKKNKQRLKKKLQDNADPKLATLLNM